MTAPHADQLIDGYLARLSTAAADLPKGPRTELIDDMRAHIAEARARETEPETDATILNILDRLGEPSIVVADARERLGLHESLPASPIRPGILEIAALVLLLVFWPAGVVLLWISPLWKTGDKLIGTLVPPGGYFALPMLGLFATIQGSGQADWVAALWMIVVILLLILPLLSTAYLGMRLRQRSRTSPKFA